MHAQVYKAYFPQDGCFVAIKRINCLEKVLICNLWQYICTTLLLTKTACAGEEAPDDE